MKKKKKKERKRRRKKKESGLSLSETVKVPAHPPLETSTVFLWHLEALYERPTFTLSEKKS